MKFLKTSLYLLIPFVLTVGCSNNRHNSKATFKANIDSLSTDSLLTLVEHQTFEYFWPGAEPNSGMAPERIHMDKIILNMIKAPLLNWWKRLWRNGFARRY